MMLDIITLDCRGVGEGHCLFSDCLFPPLQAGASLYGWLIRADVCAVYAVSRLRELCRREREELYCYTATITRGVRAPVIV